MGWFWADPAPTQLPAPHPLRRAGAEPPPACPMHTADHSKLPPTRQQELSPPSGACPYKPSEPSSAPPSYISKLNPLNYMPNTISNTRAGDSPQSVILPLEREVSTIPRGDDTGTTWEYPSPQQMYNAMLRKGYTDTPAEQVEAMVAVHNFLNEGAWDEIRGWEKRFSGGLAKGWTLCQKGEEGFAHQAALDAFRRRRGGVRAEEPGEDPKLVRFMGRPNDPTPKARMMSVMAWLYPSQFPDNPPFDRHDWYVQRRFPDGQTREIRYVIDYYSGPPEPTGEPVFYLDVRPALDGPTAACERMLRWGGDVWWRASGGSVREELARLKK